MIITIEPPFIHPSDIQSNITKSTTCLRHCRNTSPTSLHFTSTPPFRPLAYLPTPKHPPPIHSSTPKNTMPSTRAPRQLRRHRQPQPSLAHTVVLSLLSLLSLCALPSLCSASTTAPSTKEYNADDVDTLHVRGFASATPGGAVTGALRKRDGAEAAFVALADVLEDVVQEDNCFLRDEAWVNAAGNTAESRGWKPPSDACNSDSSDRRKTALKSSAEETMGLLTAVGDFQDKTKKEVMENTVKNFTKVVFPRAFPFKRGTTIKQECTVERMTALRVLEGDDVKWFLLSGITNEDVTVDQPAWQRQYVNEYVGVDLQTRKFITPLQQNVKPTGVAGETADRKLAATVFEMWANRVGLSAVFVMQLADAPALKSAVLRMDQDVDQATDAVTVSNTAILALPMAINLIPVSLLADVSGFGLLFYTLLTDVLTTVPFIIKGFELISMGNRGYVEQTGWFRGKKDEPFLLVELWAADCRILHVHTFGTVFVVVGFGAMVLGIISELVARRLRKKWTEEGTLDQSTLTHIKIALLGAEAGMPSRKNQQQGEPSFDPDDENAAFLAQQAVTLRKGPSGV